MECFECLLQGVSGELDRVVNLMTWPFYSLLVVGACSCDASLFLVTFLSSTKWWNDRNLWFSPTAHGVSDDSGFGLRPITMDNGSTISPLCEGEWLIISCRTCITQKSYDLFNRGLKYLLKHNNTIHPICCCTGWLWKTLFWSVATCKVVYGYPWIYEMNNYYITTCDIVYRVM